MFDSGQEKIAHVSVEQLRAFVIDQMAGAVSLTRSPERPPPGGIIHIEYVISTAQNVLGAPFSQGFLSMITLTEERSSRRREWATAFERIGDEAREWQQDTFATAVITEE